MVRKLSLDELAVTSYETSVAPRVLLRYTPDCCTDDNSGCKTGPETGCTVDTTQAP